MMVVMMMTWTRKNHLNNFSPFAKHWKDVTNKVKTSSFFVIRLGFPVTNNKHTK